MVDYTYNLNGWLKTMNNPGNLASGKDFFGMSLSYDADGNISSQNFAYADRIAKHTDPGFNVKAGPLFNNAYIYDPLKRILSHTIGTGGAASNILDLRNTYDANGNIKTMRRVISGVTVDDMSYTYDGNRIKNIVETGGGDNDPRYETFKQKSTGDYQYDIAGNITVDPYKGITGTTYNYLNLPSSMTGRNWKQYYTEGGIKVRSETGDGTYDYLGPAVFKANKLEFISTAEGRVLAPGTVRQDFTYNQHAPDTTNLFWRYEYSLKDHLGNLRVACRCAEKAEIDQETRKDGYKPLVVQQAHGVYPERFYYFAV